MAEELKFCMCCGENVPTVLVERDGRSELNCVHCGFTLDIPAPEPEAPHRVPCIIAVDDADVHRSVLRGLLERSGLAEEVVTLNGGADLVTTIARRFAENRPVDLVILDVEMPAMDGFTAARFLRSLEAKMRRPPCPVIFFTGKIADENLRRQMSVLRPAWYCAKGGGVDRGAFERRAARLIGHVTTLLAGPGAPGPAAP